MGISSTISQIHSASLHRAVFTHTKADNLLSPLRSAKSTQPAYTERYLPIPKLIIPCDQGPRDYYWKGSITASIPAYLQVQLVILSRLLGSTSFLIWINIFDS